MSFQDEKEKFNMNKYIEYLGTETEYTDGTKVFQKMQTPSCKFQKKTGTHL